MNSVTLRAIEPEDLDVLYQIENDRRLWNVGTTNVPYSRYTLHDYLATSADDAFADKQVRMVVENAQHEMVGIADVVNFNPSHCRAEVGIVIMDAHRRRGYAETALQELCHYAQQVLHLHQVYAVVASDNLPAVALFEKVGFQQQQVLKDWLYDGKAYHNAVLMQTFF